MDAAEPKRTLPRPSWSGLLVAYVVRAVWVAVAYGCYQLAVSADRSQVVPATVTWMVLLPAAALGLELYRRRERLEAAPAHLSLEQRSKAWAASRGGPVPLDRAIRVEALRLARAESGPGRQELVVLSIMAGVGTLAAAVAAVLFSPWWWGTALAVAVAGFAAALVARRRRARLLELEHLAAEAATRRVSARGRRASP